MTGLHTFEQKIQRIPNLNALILRPGMVHGKQFGTSKDHSDHEHHGRLAQGRSCQSHKSPRATLAHIAADAFLQLKFTGKTTRELLGQRDVSMKETAAAFGKAIGKPALGYSQFPGFAVEMAMKQMGMSGQPGEIDGRDE